MGREKDRTKQASTFNELLDIGISLSTEKDLDRLLNKIVVSARRLCRADAGSLYILNRAKTDLIPRVFQCETFSGRIASLPPVSLRVEGKPNLGQICGYCALLGRIVNIPDAYRYSGFNFHELYERDRATGYRSRSVLAAPLRNHENLTIGVIELVNAMDADRRRVVPFSTEQEETIRAFASYAAVSIDNVQLIEEKRRLISILEGTNRRLQEENLRLRDRLCGGEAFGRIIGNSPAMQRVFHLMQKVVDTDVTVLIRGETGTGKELIARAVHSGGRRKDGEFVAINCAALPENLLESELFGYVRGAFSGADRPKKGLMEQAGRGTLFLDEIGDMPPALQAKLLRALQEGEIRPLGSTRPVRVNPRVIAATHRDLRRLIEEGRFREDLFYRLNVYPIEIPPLRERREDLPRLVHHFAAEAARRYGKPVPTVAPATLEILSAFPFPGNVRELGNVVERMVLLAEDGGGITADLVPEYIREAVGEGASLPSPAEDGGGLRKKVKAFEASLITDSLRLHGWNQTRAARELGIPRRTLIDKMQRLGVRRPPS